MLFGYENQQANSGHKRGHRWGNNPEVHLLNDYAHLLSTLFAKSAKRDSDYVREAKEKQDYLPVTDAPIDIILRLWEEVMPQCQIEFQDGKVMAQKNEQNNYHGKEMSDGERVTLYLMGQCLIAPDNSIVIIDEPEIHLHKSLMARLWNKIEEECPNKLLVFITHDLDFAASRKEAKKIWIKEYNGGDSWIWEELPEIDDIPEDLVIEIAGNRKNVIFIEGERSSYDVILYQAVFPDYHIIPRGGHEKVIESTRAMRNTPALHHLSAFGIIDSDYMTEDEIEALRENGVYTISVAEIENLFCIEPLLRIVAVNQQLNPDEVVQNVTDFIIQCLRDEFDTQVTNHAEREIQYRLNTYTKNDNTEKGLQEGLESLLSRIDINSIYTNSRNLYENVINQNNLEAALQIYNRKSLSKRISSLFQLREGEYVDLLLRLLKSERKTDIVIAIQRFMPILE